MTPNKNIFCNTPWYEIHVYWDGKFGICCQEDHLLYSELDTQYNIHSMSMMDWFNSEPVKKFRKEILGNNRLSVCKRCYVDEDSNGESRRQRSNQKSVIFTTAFDASFKQSPGLRRFNYSKENQGLTNSYPIDLHVDLGNFCNLACKMCKPAASSTFASQTIKWGIESNRQYLGLDWTRNPQTWANFKNELVSISGLNNIHFMGGETLLTDQFENLVDHLIENNKTDVCLSFVTNGTVFRPHLIQKLQKFKRVGLEISIESITAHNSYIRQGTDTHQVLQHIKQYQNWCHGSSITVSLRPAPSILSIGYLPSLLEYALDNNFVVKGNICYNPKFLDATVLPQAIKELYKTRYRELLIRLENVDIAREFNGSDPNETPAIVKRYALMCLSILESGTSSNQPFLLKELVAHCKKWDTVYKLNAKELYPELADIFDEYGY